MDTTEIPTPQPGCDGDPMASITEHWADLLGCTKSMCAVMRSFNSSIDIGYAPIGLGEQVWAELTTLSNLVDAARISITPSIIASGRWKTEGSKTPEDWLGGKTGSSTGRARAQLETAKNLRKAPGTQESFLNGEISAEQAETIADAVEANPAAEDDLLDQAKRDSLKNLKDEAARRKAEVEDIEERERRLHRKRYVRQWTDKEGAWNLRARGPIPTGSEFMAVLEGLIDQQFKKARKSGVRGTRDNYGYDALMDLANQHGWGTGNGNPSGNGPENGNGGRTGGGPGSGGAGPGRDEGNDGSGPADGNRGGTTSKNNGRDGGSPGPGCPGPGSDPANEASGNRDESTGTGGNGAGRDGGSDGNKPSAPTSGQPVPGEPTEAVSDSGGPPESGPRSEGHSSGRGPSNGSASRKPTTGEPQPGTAPTGAPGPSRPKPGHSASNNTGPADPASRPGGRGRAGRNSGSGSGQNADPFEPVENGGGTDKNQDAGGNTNGPFGRRGKAADAPGSAVNGRDPGQTPDRDPGIEPSALFEGRLFDIDPASQDGEGPSGPEQRPQAKRPGRKQAKPAKQRIFCIDWTALARGRIHPGERCELRGVGMVSVRAIRQALTAGTARMVVTDTDDRVVTVALIGTGAINGRLFPMGSSTGPALDAPDAADLTVAEANASNGPSTVIVGVRLTDPANAEAETTHRTSNGAIDIPGVGPIGNRQLANLLGSELANRLAERGQAIREVTHTGRAPSTAQRIALAWADTTCKVAGCTSQRVEIDHRRPWASERVTELDNLDPLCAHHHDLKTNQGWAFSAVEPGRFVSPDDPGHPGRQPGSGTSGHTRAS